MEIYAAVFLLIALLTPIDLVASRSELRRATMLLPFALMALLAGTRNEIGNDWEPYWDHFRAAGRLGDNAENFEIGYRVLVQAAKGLSIEYPGFVFLSTLIYLACMYFVFAKQKGPLTLTLLFYVTYLLGWMGTARQVIAIALTLLAVECLLARRRWLFAGLVVLASTFHLSALAFLLVRFVPWRLPKASTCVGLAAVAAVLGLLLEYVAPTLIDRFLGTEGLGDKVVYYAKFGIDDLDIASGNFLTILWYIKRLAFLAVFVLLRHRWQTHALKFYFNLYLISVLIFLVVNPVLPIAAVRLSLYFAVYELFLLAALIGVPRWRWAPLALVVLVLVAGQRLYTSLYGYHPELLIPYRSYLFDFR
jgi:EpsG family